MIPISAIALGTWQVRRKKWKENLIKELQTKTKFPAIEFPEKFELTLILNYIYIFIYLLNFYSEDELLNLEYRRVKVVGEFDHSKELYLGPRSCLMNGGSDNGNGLFSSSGSTKSGYYVITPFKLSNRPYVFLPFIFLSHMNLLIVIFSLTILVNRGWVSMQNKNPVSRAAGQVIGEIELEGIIRSTEPRPQFVSKNVADSRNWSYRQIIFF